MFYQQRGEHYHIASLQLNDKFATAPFPVLQSDFNHHYPHYSSIAKRIAYVSNESGYYELWTANQLGSDRKQLTNLKQSIRYPHWSHDGTKIAFCSSYPGGFSHWNIRSGERMTEEEFSHNHCYSICYTSDGKEVIIGAHGVTIIYNVKTETHQLHHIPGIHSVSSAFREASEVCNIINETNTHLEDVGFKLTTDNGLKFILSWNKKIE